MTMRNRIQMALVALAAVMGMAIATGVASANRLSLDDQDFAFRFPEFTITAGGIGEVTCPATLTGRAHSSTFVKASRSLVGFVNSATVDDSRCEGGGVTVLSESLPWHVTYDSFVGTLPNITRIVQAVVGLSAQAEVGGVTCLAALTESDPLMAILDFQNGRLILEIVSAEEIDTTDVDGGSLCDLFGVRAELRALTYAVEDGEGGSVGVTLI
jgi:hypothetical protein